VSDQPKGIKPGHDARRGDSGSANEKGRPYERPWVAGERRGPQIDSSHPPRQAGQPNRRNLCRAAYRNLTTPRRVGRDQERRTSLIARSVWRVSQREGKSRLRNIRDVPKCPSDPKIPDTVCGTEVIVSIPGQPAAEQRRCILLCGRSVTTQGLECSRPSALGNYVAGGGHAQEAEQAPQYIIRLGDEILIPHQHAPGWLRFTPSRSSQAASSSSSRIDLGSGAGALIPASAASHRSARLRIASAPFLSFVRAANRRQRSACALNSLASTSHLVPAMALAPCPMLTSREAGFGHGRSCEIVSPMSD